MENRHSFDNLKIECVCMMMCDGVCAVMQLCECVCACCDGVCVKVCVCEGVCDAPAEAVH